MPSQQTQNPGRSRFASATPDSASSPESASMEAVITTSQEQDRERMSPRTLPSFPTAAAMQDIGLTSGLGLNDPLYAGILPSLLQPCHPQDQIFDSEPVFSFENGTVEQFFQSDIFLPISPKDLNTAFPVGLDERFTVPDLSPSQSDTQRSVASFALEDTDYALLQANVALFDPEGRLSNFQFPSKYAVVRFVKGFFSHMASNLPIVHGPTFQIIAVPSPLLLEIMACGALYVNESATATKMHMAALQLLSEIDEISLCENTDKEFKTWLLQAYLLGTYFATYSGGIRMERQITQTFCHSIQLAHEAIEVLMPSVPSTYKEWVDQETMRRCIAGSIIMGAALSATLKYQYFNIPFIHARFPLASPTAEWTKDENIWRLTPVMYSSDAAEKLFAGQKADLGITEFGFLTIVASVLYQICLFESYAGSTPSELCADFFRRLHNSLQSIDDMWRHQTADKDFFESSPSALTQCTRSFLDSAYYHLYGSQHLAIMKKLLYTWTNITGLDELQLLCANPHASILHIALLRAADSLRYDCRTGIKYLRKMAPFRFGPISANSICEGSLLLCWYLRAKQSCHPALERNPSVEALIEECAAELESLQSITAGQVEVLPLAVTAELIQEDSVWQWPPTLAKKLMDLISRIQL
ncbi:hypothetical protein N7449_012240 [Penicillium cf. viridicatum]|uniref:Xylanolytic transcriptional activator regulatory domain-containing protein n=1 Tax=Penicillium cf. viridicatum TaxID=2972119 RepID=A0A9W9LY02_9EURO|nr:hypothetical protein N7449_012240 [Penicillium cf. viridicatum]